MNLGSAKQAVSDHANKAAHLGSYGLIAFLMTLFVGKDAFQQHCHQCEKWADKCEAARAENWQETQEREVEIAKLQAEVDMLKRRYAGFTP